MKLFITCLLSLLTFTFSSKSNHEWKRKHNKDGISVDIRSSDLGLNEFKATTIIDAPLSSIYAVITDLDNPTETKERINSCKLLKSYSLFRNICYFTLDMPWPLSDRDLVSEAITTVSTDKIFISLASKPDYIEKEDDFVRIQIFSGHWKLKKISSTKTEVEFQLLTSPEKLPSWLVNMFLLDTPINTLKKLKIASSEAPYKNTSYDWLAPN